MMLIGLLDPEQQNYLETEHLVPAPSGQGYLIHEQISASVIPNFWGVFF